MFVKNKEKIDFNYRKNGYLAVLKAGTVSYVDETKISAKELLACYGQRIDIISRELALEIAPKIKEVKKEEKKAAPKKVETVKKEDLNDSFIEKILGEIEGEDKAKKEENLKKYEKGERWEVKWVEKSEVTPTPAPTEAPKATKTKSTKTKAASKARKPRAKKA